jgi:hypothetical protein
MSEEITITVSDSSLFRPGDKVLVSTEPWSGWRIVRAYWWLYKRILRRRYEARFMHYFIVVNAQ